MTGEMICGLREGMMSDGPYIVVQGKYIWQVVDQRTGKVRATSGTEDGAKAAAAHFNRQEQA
jgi:hypothetical protein